ncbi:DNA-binding Lrp family transcriptional regulator [Herbaspirillum sp. Sphag1AN]|uniref:Lrp/AsnC family transcriptional regulator n=1 Tax=unclassified Herbaspirillum TaxID=2624150 RepID=UPI00161E8E4B|nr:MULTISPECIES: Lrp/AsnC family transcriptional regulator [unclassified Herbaspirillum]MBB3213560.1 DNA-binding Lrp family transcriptional regulator [Herbaspirillum sp. Sphag1AN]MBB3246758.1 DNA-binding Lrp family transcriptional regulator [Herbaspirillum sp. Sphag64]
MSFTIDEYDRMILDLLRDNGRLSNQDLADLVGLSASQCSRRRSALEKSGLILGYHAHLSPQAEGTPVMGMVEVRLINHTREAVELFSAFVRSAPAVRDVFKLTGDFDYLLKIALPNLGEMSQLVTDLASLQGSVSHLRTSVVLERVKENGIVFTTTS